MDRNKPSLSAGSQSTMTPLTSTTKRFTWASWLLRTWQSTATVTVIELSECCHTQSHKICQWRLLKTSKNGAIHLRTPGWPSVGKSSTWKPWWTLWLAAVPRNNCRSRLSRSKMRRSRSFKRWRWERLHWRACSSQSRRLQKISTSTKLPSSNLTSTSNSSRSSWTLSRLCTARSPLRSLSVWRLLPTIRCWTPSASKRSQTHIFMLRCPTKSSRCKTSFERQRVDKQLLVGEAHRRPTGKQRTTETEWMKSQVCWPRLTGRMT